MYSVNTEYTKVLWNKLCRRTKQIENHILMGVTKEFCNHCNKNISEMFHRENAYKNIFILAYKI